MIIYIVYEQHERKRIYGLVLLQAKMRSSSWWVRYFLQINLEENDAASKKFAQASTKSSYIPNCQIFHLKSLN